MNENMYTSLELSKKLESNWCKLQWHANMIIWGENDWKIENNDIIIEIYNCYDLARDVCIKYPKEFFWEKYNRDVDLEGTICEKIMYQLQEGNKEKAEALIRDNCLFNNTSEWK